MPYIKKTQSTKAMISESISFLTTGFQLIVNDDFASLLN